MTAPLHSPIGRELLDDPAADPALVRESLHHLARSNAWFGGLAAARAGVRRLLATHPDRVVTLLDVGTGPGDIPLGLGRWLSGRGTTLRSFGIDRHPAAAALAQAGGVPTVVADGFRLPFADARFDLVMVSQLAHHFSRDGVVALLREATRVARVGVVLADLRRSQLAQLGFRIGSRLLGFDPVTRADGVTSLARGFVRRELVRLLISAGFNPTVTTHLGARIVATWSVPDPIPTGNRRLSTVG
jgi:SAM-dependent methyltransferase